MTNPRLLIKPENYSKRRYPNQQDWTIQQIALFKPKPRHRKTVWWVTVQMPDKTIRHYQLPKDLQFALKLKKNYQAQKREAQQILVNSLINVPISKYDQQGNVELTCAKILSVCKHKSTKHPDKITRSQFIKPDYNFFGILKIKHIYTFLRHDFNHENRKRIFFSILKLTPLVKASHS